MKIIKKLLFLLFALISLAQSRLTFSAEFKNNQQIELGENSQSIEIEPQEENLENSIYLPSDCSVSTLEELTQLQAIKLLKYLSIFNNIAINRSPFTQEDQEIFDSVMAVEKDTKVWLTYGQVLVLSCTLINLMSLIAVSNKISTEESVIIPASLVTIFTALGTYLSFYATGTLPDKASQKANVRQYKFDELKDTYVRLARVWIKIYFSSLENKKLAERLAFKIKNSFENLRGKIKEKVGYDHADNMLSPIKEAMHYILNPQDEKLDISPVIHDYIISKENQRRLEQPD